MEKRIEDLEQRYTYLLEFVETLAAENILKLHRNIDALNAGVQKEKEKSQRHDLEIKELINAKCNVEESIKYVDRKLETMREKLNLYVNPNLDNTKMQMNEEQELSQFPCNLCEMVFNNEMSVTNHKNQHLKEFRLSRDQKSFHENPPNL